MGKQHNFDIIQKKILGKNYKLEPAYVSLDDPFFDWIFKWMESLKFQDEPSSQDKKKS